jgi:hypothetical protein
MRHKGHDVLFESLAILKRQGRLRHRLVLTGAQGAGWPLLRLKAIRLGISDEVQHLGLVDRPTVWSLYRAADAVLFPSRFEGFGLPVLEAAALDRRVIVSRLEVFEEIGVPPEWRIDFGNPEELAAALDRPGPTRLLRTPATWEDVASRTLECLRSVASRHRHAPDSDGLDNESERRSTGYPAIHADAIRDRLADAGLNVRSHQIDVAAFRRYVATATYPDSYRQTFGDLFWEKALEHFVSLVLIGNITDGMDVASCSSPFADIVAERTGRPMYRQDLTFAPGVSGWSVGSSADALPLPDRSLGAMTLHCSFEHFEGNADTGLIREAARVLRPGGRLCILPLYLADTFANITDPAIAVEDARFDPGAPVHVVKGFNNRFGRFYDVGELTRRVLSPARDAFHAALYDIVGAQELDPRCYLRFALVLERRQ